MRVMGLDIATVCGVAIGEPGCIPDSFSVRLKGRHEDAKVAAFNIFAFLRDRFAADKPDLVCIEEFVGGVKNRPFASLILQLKCHGAADAACGAFGVRVETAHVATVRKHFCGRTYAADRASTKRMVLDRAKMLGYLPRDCDDDNRADALAVWDYACAKYGNTARMTKELVLFGERLVG